MVVLVGLCVLSGSVINILRWLDKTCYYEILIEDTVAYCKDTRHPSGSFVLPNSKGPNRTLEQNAMLTYTSS